MNQDDIIAFIKDQMERIGITDIASIAFALIQEEAERKSEGDIKREAIELKGMHARITEAFDEEYAVLNGGEGNSYTA